MNEWERRQLEVMQNHVDLVEVTRQMRRDAIVEYFSYTIQIGSTASPLLNGVPQQGLINIRADSWFVLEYIITGVIRNDAVVGRSRVFSASNIRLQIQDTGAGEVLYSAPSLATLLAGSVEPGAPGIPILLPIPRLIAPNTNIKIEATQVGNAVGNQQPDGFFVMLSGARVERI